MESQVVDTSRFLKTERLIAQLTLVIGVVAGAVAALLHNWLWAAGLVVGAVLAWFNFRWLKQGLDALTNAATAQSASEKPRVPIGTYFRMLFRYALIGLAVYVIFNYLKVPVLSMIAGLCALGAATLVATVYEILRPVE